MANRLPRNFAIDPINGSYGDKEDRLAQAIADASGTGSGGTTSQTITQGIEDSESIETLVNKGGLGGITYDSRDFVYSGDSVISITYKNNGTVVAIETITYVNGNVTNITRS